MPHGLPLRRLLHAFALCALLAVGARPLRAIEPAEPASPPAGTAATSAVAEPPAAAAANPSLAVVFVTAESVLAENFPQPAPLTAWLKPVLAAAESAIAAHAEHPAVLIQITLGPDAAPRFELAGRPVLPDDFAADLRTHLAALPDLRAPLCQVCIRVQTPGGTASPLTEAATFIPRLFPPEEAAINRFLAADLATKYGELRAWSRTHALPLLAHRAAASDPQYSGVVSVGRTLAALGPDATIDVDRIAYRNPDYWRGVMEMAPGDQLMAALPVFLHAAAGDIDQASTLLGLLHAFGRDNTLAHQLLNEFAARLGPFRRQLNTEVLRGIAFHEDGKFAEAVAQHERTVAAYPNSAWARYELFFSSVSRDGLDTRKKIKRANKLWDETAPGIFRCNPLYTSQFGATRGKSVGAMLDRLVLHRLTNKPPEDFGERVGSMADAALRLEDYGTAALLYWSSLGTAYQLKGLSFLSDEPVALTKEDVLARYLYCLEKLGVPDWKGEFEGDFTGALARLDSALTAHRRQ
jgi:hypothetical protein